MTSFLQKIRITLLPQTTDPNLLEGLLESASVPLHTGDCRNCSDPCSEGHEEYKFERDMETQMLGSVKPYLRQIVISTGQIDWEKDVTKIENSLAAMISNLFSENSPAKPVDATAKELQRSTPGVFAQRDGTRLSILNGNHKTISEDPERATVLIFPEYRLAFGVNKDLGGAKLLYENAISPSVTYIPTIPDEKEDGELPFGILPIPYSCVILLCSHKRRDKRCHISAPILQKGLSSSLKKRGWEVDEYLDHSHLHDVRPPSKSHTTGVLGPSPELDEVEDEGADEVPKANGLTPFPGDLSPRKLWELKRVLIIKTSHFGGHALAGNVVIYTPAGQSIWYGRVTPHEVDAIVEQTIIGGKIIPTLFRGGMNVSTRPGCKSLYDW